VYCGGSAKIRIVGSRISDIRVQVSIFRGNRFYLFGHGNPKSANRKSQIRNRLTQLNSKLTILLNLRDTTSSHFCFWALPQVVCQQAGNEPWRSGLARAFKFKSFTHLSRRLCCLLYGFAACCEAWLCPAVNALKRTGFAPGVGLCLLRGAIDLGNGLIHCLRSLVLGRGFWVLGLWSLVFGLWS